VLSLTWLLGAVATHAAAPSGPSYDDARAAIEQLTNAPPVAAITQTNTLQPLDQLLLTIEDDPVQGDEPITVTITDLGEAHFPVSRGFATSVTLKVTGKSLDEVKSELKAKLDEEYYHDAQVSLRMLSRGDSAGTAYFFGAVRGSVRLPPGRKLTVAEAILGLGYSEFANLKRVTINRRDPATNQPIELRVDVQAVLAGAREQDVELQDGDRVEVAEKSFLIR
jgi:protein involved in polysaccharide export with SLBB domain